MPREFYPDTHTVYAHDDPTLCFDEITLWDGPGICTRLKGHKVDAANTMPNGEYHQEAFEGWVWNNEGAVG